MQSSAVPFTCEDAVEFTAALSCVLSPWWFMLFFLDLFYFWLLAELFKQSRHCQVFNTWPVPCYSSTECSVSGLHKLTSKGAGWVHKQQNDRIWFYKLMCIHTSSSWTDWINDWNKMCCWYVDLIVDSSTFCWNKTLVFSCEIIERNNFRCLRFILYYF